MKSANLAEAKVVRLAAGSRKIRIKLSSTPAKENAGVSVGMRDPVMATFRGGDAYGTKRLQRNLSAIPHSYIKGRYIHMRKLFTSESVTEGHPDKLCDQVSDAVLDALLTQDPMARVACETSASTGLIMVMGEITTETYVDIDAIARDVVKRHRLYTSADMCFDYNTCAVLTAVHAQSPDIAHGRG